MKKNLLPLLLLITASFLVGSLWTANRSFQGEVKITPSVIRENSPTTEEIQERVKEKVQERLRELKEQSNLPTVSPKLTPTPKSIRTQFNIVVTSTIVKKVNGKYRYFFDIRNKDTEPFGGTIEISIYNSTGLLLNERAFSTDELNAGQIEPGLGMARYIDAYTGPAEIHGEFGVSKFKYKALMSKQVVKQGEGSITSNFEKY